MLLSPVCEGICKSVYTKWPNYHGCQLGLLAWFFSSIVNIIVMSFLATYNSQLVLTDGLNVCP